MLTSVHRITPILTKDSFPSTNGTWPLLIYSKMVEKDLYPIMCGKYMLPNLVLNSYLLDLRRHVYLTLPIPRLSIRLFPFLNIQDLVFF